MVSEVTKGFIENFSKTIIKKVAGQTVEQIKVENAIRNKVSEIVSNHVSEKQQALNLRARLNQLLESDDEVKGGLTTKLLCKHDEAVNFLLEQYNKKKDRFVQEDILKTIIDEIVSYLFSLLPQSERDEVSHENQQSMKDDLERILNILGVGSQNKVVEITNPPEVLSNQEFIPRENEMKDLMNIVQQNKSVVLINGLGGVGKTTIGKKLYSEIKEDYDLYGWFIYNESMEKTLLEQCNLFLKEKENRLMRIITELNNNPGKKLLCIDNVDANCSKDDLFKSLNGYKNMTVIATSRLDRIKHFETYNIDLMSEDKCIELFKLYNNDISEEWIKKFIKLVQRHTLGVELLAKSFPRKYKRNPEEYYNQLKEKGFGYSTKEIDGKTISENLKILFDISEKTKSEKRILYYFSLKPSIEIPIEVIEWINCDENDIDRLCKTGWLKDNDNSFYMHPIIKETVLLEKKFYPEDLGKEFVEYLANKPFIDNKETYIEILPKLDIAKSIMDYQKLDEDVHLGSAYNNLAVLYQAQGKYEESEEYYKKALAIREKVLGSDHPDTATMYNNLAVLYQAQGKYEESKEYNKKALAIREKVLGSEHPDTATTYNNLALLYQAQGKYEEAEEYYKKALAIREKVLGSEHPDTATTYNNLAGLYQAQGKYEEAEEYYKKALAIREKVLGSDHPDTATMYNNLAVLYQAQGKYEEAEEYYKKALGILFVVLGENHPNTQIVLENLYYLLQKMGKV